MIISKAAAFIIWALKQVGKEYEMGGKGTPLAAENFNNLDAFRDVKEWDCSGLVTAGLCAAGVEQITDGLLRKTPLAQFQGSYNQVKLARPLSIAAARGLPGALVFSETAGKVSHVAISLGNGYVVEARGEKYGVCISPWRASFVRAAKVAELYVPVIP